MSAVMRAFVPTLSLTQSQQKLQKLLTAGKGKRYFRNRCCALCSGGQRRKGLTFAVEPIKLALSETLENNNK